MNALRMPWGVHRGELISELPAPYVKWLITAKCFDGLHPHSQSYVKERYEKIMKDEQETA